MLTIATIGSCFKSISCNGSGGSSPSIAQTASQTSSAIGGYKLSVGQDSRHAAMLARAIGFGSDGIHSRGWSREAKKTACSPVPLEISNTVPLGGSTCNSTSRIGSRLRCVAGAYCRASRKLFMGTFWSDRNLIMSLPYCKSLQSENTVYPCKSLCVRASRRT